MPGRLPLRKRWHKNTLRSREETFVLEFVCRKQYNKI